jgi:transposase
MMGTKARLFTPVPAVSLDELVPTDHFYRHVERVLDLAFVRDLVQDCYAACGRPSVDPIVFFKLPLVMFFEGVRSERLLMRLVADRLSVLWYLGYTDVCARSRSSSMLSEAGAREENTLSPVG